MTDKPILYSFRRCPYAMRARMALLISETAVELREVKLSAKPAAMLAISPKGTVPVLATVQGTVIEESLDIMHWALARSDPAGWLERIDHGLIAANDGPFKHALDRYKYPHRHGSDPAKHRAIGLAILHKLEDRLTGHQHLSGELPGFTDAAIMPFVRQFAATDRDWFDQQELPGVGHWLDWHLSSDVFVACMTKLKPWEPGAAILERSKIPGSTDRRRRFPD